MDSPPPMDDVDVEEEIVAEPSAPQIIDEPSHVTSKPASKDSDLFGKDEEDDLFGGSEIPPDVEEEEVEEPKKVEKTIDVPPPRVPTFEPTVEEVKPTPAPVIEAPKPVVEAPKHVEPSAPLFVAEPTPTPAPSQPVAKPKPMPAPARDEEDDFAVPSSSAGDDEAPSRSTEVDESAIVVSVSDPEKIGDGFGSYMVYKITTKTTLESFAKPEFSVKHRYSDFHALYKHLVESYPAVIVPLPPPKDAISTTVGKFKQAKEITPFIERRKEALQRFLTRVVRHPVLQKAEVVQMFLENESKMPKPKTSLLNDVVSKLGTFVEEDAWFDEKAREVEAFEAQMKAVHTAVNTLVEQRKEMQAASLAFAEGFGALADVEELEALTKVMHSLSDVEVKVAKYHSKQATRDFYEFSEIVTDYLGLVEAIQIAFQNRRVAYKTWKSAEQNLAKKKETEAKLTAANKTDKLDQAAREVKEAEELVANSKKEFENISRDLKAELELFDVNKVKELQATLVNYIESMMTMQHQIGKVWESFLPEAKALAL